MLNWEPKKKGYTCRVDGTAGQVRAVIRNILGAFTFASSFAFASFAAAQTFKTAPKTAEEEAEAAAGGLDFIFGIHINTIFFIAAAVIAVYWFTLGGGRKVKVSRDAK